MRHPRNRIPLLAVTTIVASVGTGMAEPLSFSNNIGGTLDLYGQLSPTYLGINDGEKTYGNLADNAHSNSRVGLTLEQPVGVDNTVGFWFESALGAPQTSSFSQNYDPIWEWDKTKLRHIDFSIGGSWGKVSLGQGSMSTDGVATFDQSGTAMGSYVYAPDTAGSYFFRQKDGDLSEITVTDIFNDFDGGRKGRLRYDTPSWNGLRFTASYGQEILADTDDDKLFDLAVFYENELGDFEFGTGLGYAWVDYEEKGKDTGESWAGSFAITHSPTGLNGTFAAGAQLNGGNYWYLKGGWIGDFWSVGNTAFSIDYYDGSDFVTSGAESESAGVQVSQMFDSANLEAYLAYNEYNYSDKTDTSYQKMTATVAGIRWKF